MHNLRRGECLQATPSPLTAEAEVPVIETPESEVPEEQEETVIDGPIVEELFSDAEDEDAVKDVAATAILQGQEPSAYPSPEKLKQYPHVCMAMLGVATWESHELIAVSETDVPLLQMSCRH